MPFKPLALAMIAGAIPAPTAFAAAPGQANNKSVELNWRETRSDKILWSGKVHNFSIQSKLTLYISQQGKVFSEMIRNGNLVRQAGGEKPQGNNGNRTWKINDWHFEGRTLVGLQGFGPNGARRMAIEFDEGFSSCRATIRSGRATSANMIATYMDTGEKAEVLSETIESPSCAVHEGNPFAR